LLCDSSLPSFGFLTDSKLNTKQGESKWENAREVYDFADFTNNSRLELSSFADFANPIS
jgi:hypothetical protein